MERMKVHPVARQLAALLAPLEGRERADLKDDIKHNGVQVPILVTKSKDTIIDGQNRWKIAHELGIPTNEIPVEVYEGAPADIMRVIFSRNVYRRHLSEEKRLALITDILVPELERQAAEQKKATQFQKGEAPTKTEAAPINVRKILAGEAHASEHAAGQALKARKAGLLKQVMKGKMTLKQAAKKAGKPKRKTPKKTKTLEDRVWIKYSALIRAFGFDERREVKTILRRFLSRPDPK